MRNLFRVSQSVESSIPTKENLCTCQFLKTYDIGSVSLQVFSLLVSFKKRYSTWRLISYVKIGSLVCVCAYLCTDVYVYKNTSLLVSKECVIFGFWLDVRNIETLRDKDWQIHKVLLKTNLKKFLWEQIGGWIKSQSFTGDLSDFREKNSWC